MFHHMAVTRATVLLLVIALLQTDSSLARVQGITDQKTGRALTATAAASGGNPADAPVPADTSMQMSAGYVRT